MVVSPISSECFQAGGLSTGHSSIRWTREQRNFANFRRSCFTYFNRHDPNILLTATFKKKDFRSAYISDILLALAILAEDMLGKEIPVLWRNEYGGKRGRPHFHVVFEVEEESDAFKEALRRLMITCWSHGSFHVDNIKPGEKWDVMWYLTSHGKPRDPKTYKNDIGNIKKTFGGTRAAYTRKKFLKDYLPHEKTITAGRNEPYLWLPAKDSQLDQAIKQVQHLEGHWDKILEAKVRPSKSPFRPCDDDKHDCNGLCPRCEKFYQSKNVTTLIELLEQTQDPPPPLEHFLGVDPLSCPVRQPQGIAEEDTMEACHWLLVLQQREYQWILDVLRQDRWVQIQGLADLLRKSLIYNFERAKAQLHELAAKLGRLPKLKDFYDEKGAYQGYRWILKGIRKKEWVLLYGVSNFSELIDQAFGRKNRRGRKKGLTTGDPDLDGVMGTLREWKTWLGRRPTIKGIEIKAPDLLERIGQALFEYSWVKYGIKTFEDLLVKTFGPSLDQAIAWLRELGADYRLKARRRKLPTGKMVQKAYPEVMYALHQDAYLKDGVKTFGDLVKRTFDLDYAVALLKKTWGKRQKLPTKKKVKYVYPWILDAIRREDWTSEGVKTFTDLLHKTFGKANRGSYHSGFGLAIAMSALQALADKYERLPTYRITKKEACGILKAIEREEWVTEDVLTYNDLLQKTFGEMNRVGSLVTP